MKKTITQTREVICCDNCGDEDIMARTCLKCGEEYCWECAELEGVLYYDGVYHQCHDGFYCHDCNQALMSKEDKLHRAFMAVTALRDELAGWDASFKRRTKQAEGALKALLEARK